MPGNCPYRFQNSVLSWFPGRDETGNTVSSRLVLRFWINWKSRLVSNLDFRRLKSLVLSWKAFCCLDLSWIYLSCLDVLACLVLKKFQDFVPVSSCLVSRFSCPDPSLPFAMLYFPQNLMLSNIKRKITEINGNVTYVMRCLSQKMKKFCQIIWKWCMKWASINVICVKNYF